MAFRGDATAAEVIVTGDDRRHDLIAAVQAFTLLASEAGFAARPAIGLKRFVNPRPKTRDADLYVLYTDGGEFPADQQEALAGLLAEGKCLLALHGAVAAGRANGEEQARRSPYQRLIGALGATLTAGFWGRRDRPRPYVREVIHQRRLEILTSGTVCPPLP
jgi:uncharacterized protein